MRRTTALQRRVLLAGALTAGALTAAACALCSSTAGAAPSGAIIEISAGLSGKSAPQLLAPGPDGNIWFTDQGSTKAIGRITPSGAIVEFSEGLANFPFDIVSGPDGNLWFADSRAIGRITPSGAISEFSAGLEGKPSEPERITLGPDGNLWFSDEAAPTFNTVGRITPGGAIMEIPTKDLMAGSHPHGLASGSDGNIWFTDGGLGTAAIGRIAPCGPLPCTPTPEEFMAGLNASSDPESIAPGPDGNLWFTDDGKTPAIGRVTPCGTPKCTPTTEEFTLPPGSAPFAIAPGPDGKLWFTDRGTTKAIGQITPCTTTGCKPTISESSAGLNAGSEPVGIAPGADGNMWFTDRGTIPAIGQLGTGTAAAVQSPPALSGSGIVGTQQSCAPAAFASWTGQQPSIGLFGFDGYRWSLDGVPLATGPIYTPTAAQIGHTLSCSETATYPLQLVTATASSSAVTVSAAPVVLPILAPARPVITGLRQSAARWRLGSKLARISARRRAPVGTIFSLTLSESSTLSFRFTQALDGRKLAGHCVAKSKRNSKHKVCKRTVTRATLSFGAHAGTNKVAFQGRLSAHRRLRPGRYTLTVVATNTAGLRSLPRSLNFTIVS